MNTDQETTSKVMWEDFTKLYSLSKTLRFKLVPTESTEQQLKTSGVIQADKVRHESFKLAKKVLDEIHRKFIADSLVDLQLDHKQLQVFAEYSLNPALKSDVAKQAELMKLRRSIYVSFEQRFNATQAGWKETYGCEKFISSPKSQLALIESFKPELARKLDMPEQDLEDLQVRFNKFASYFQGYNENRENVYTTKGHATEISYRTIDQNLLKFYKNVQKYEKYYTDKDILGGEAAPHFKIENYTSYITQDEINVYNEAIRSFRSNINQARQGLDKKEKQSLPMFEPLFKQILGDGTKRMLFEKLESEEEYAELAQKLKQDMPGWVTALDEHVSTQLLIPVNPAAVWLNTKAVNTLLHKHTTSPELTKIYLPEEFTSSRRAKDEEAAKQNSFVSLRQLFAALDQAQAVTELSLLKNADRADMVASKAVWLAFCEDIQAKIKDAWETVGAFSKIIAFENKSEKETLKKALDSFNDLYRMYTYFELRYKNEPVTSFDTDPDFYELFDDSDDQDSLFDTDKDKRFSYYYDLIRNYLTKKPYSLDKWKLNFNCAQLLGGWDVNKEPEKHGVLLTNDGRYFLAVLDNSSKKAFEKSKNPALFKTTSSDWRKMEYKLLPGPNKMLPKCFFSRKYREQHEIPSNIDELYKKGEFKKGDNFNIDKLHRLIDFYKEAIKTYEGWTMYSFVFRDTKSYQSIDQFYHDVEEHGYKLGFVNINGNELRRLTDTGATYLFEISNKDLANSNSKTQNMHTLYFCGLFDENSNIKLNGGAEIFFRPKSMEKTEAKDRKTPQGSPIIESRRFTENKIFLHVPITINYKIKSLNNYTFNQHTIERIKTNRVDAVIGIDRGEKHLAYVAIVDKNGRLLEEPISLNNISTKLPNGSSKTTPYFDLLSSREAQRRDNRQNWDAVRQIKDLKAGYIGHCVKQIIDLMIKHNAVVVLENLNVGFKQGRSAIEKSVYSKLEQALLHKLQYVVDKSAQGLFDAQNGVQLVPPDITPGHTHNHMGFVFFVDPSYTSAVDPVTGYRQNFRLDERINTKTFSEFIKNGFSDIEYIDDNLLFTFSWRKLAAARNKIGKDNRTIEKEADISDKQWIVTADVLRRVHQKDKNDKWETIERNPQTELIKLLVDSNITLESNIKKQLIALNPTAKFIKSFIWLFNLTNQIRNSDTASSKDEIISPVYPNGFDSTHDLLDGYGWNGDANGAYNIARKGAILLDKLYVAKTPKDFKVTVSRREYDDYITKQ